MCSSNSHVARCASAQHANKNSNANSILSVCCSSSPGSKKRPQSSLLKSPRVSFAATCTVRVYPVDVDAREVWFGKRDFRAFQKDCTTTIELARSFSAAKKDQSPTVMATTFLQNIFSTRGLEHCICPRKSALRIKRRQQALDAVIGSFCDDAIAAAYQAISRDCQIEAHQRALSYHISNNTNNSTMLHHCVKDNRAFSHPAGLPLDHQLESRDIAAKTGAYDLNQTRHKRAD